MAGFAVRSEHSEHSEHRICGQVCTRHLASLHQQVQHLRILQQQVRNAAKSPEVPVFSPTFPNTAGSAATDSTAGATGASIPGHSDTFDNCQKKALQ